MRLKLSADLFNPAFFPYLTDYDNRIEIYYGGAGYKENAVRDMVVKFWEVYVGVYVLDYFNDKEEVQNILRKYKIKVKNINSVILSYCTIDK